MAPYRHFNFNRTSQQELSYQDFWDSQLYSEHPLKRFLCLWRHPRLKPYLLSWQFPLREPLNTGNSAMSVKLFSPHCYNSSRRRVSCACTLHAAGESGVLQKWLRLSWQKVPSTFCTRNLFCPRKCLCFWKRLSSNLANCSLKGASPVHSTLRCQRQCMEADASFLVNFVVLISTTTVVFFNCFSGIK